jgi:hypothetical protein
MYYGYKTKHDPMLLNGAENTAITLYCGHAGRLYGDRRYS